MVVLFLSEYLQRRTKLCATVMIFIACFLQCSKKVQYKNQLSCRCLWFGCVYLSVRVITWRKACLALKQTSTKAKFTQVIKYTHTHTHTHSGKSTKRHREKGGEEKKKAANIHHRHRYCIIDNVTFGKENTNETFEAIKNWSLTSSTAIASWATAHRKKYHQRRDP